MRIRFNVTVRAAILPRMPNRAARLSGIVLVVIGIAILVLSVVGTAKALRDPAWLDSQLAAAGPALEDNPLFQQPALTWMIVISGLLGLVESALSIALGVYVYQARRWAIITSILLSALRLVIVGLLLLLQMLVASLAPSAAGSTRDLLFSVGATVTLLALIGLLIVALREPTPHQRSAK